MEDEKKANQQKKIQQESNITMKDKKRANREERKEDSCFNYKPRTNAKHTCLIYRNNIHK